MPSLLLLISTANAGNFLPYETTLADRLLSLLGIAVMVGLAWVLSVDRKAIRWRPVLWGVGLQLAFGLVVLSPALQRFFFDVVDQGVRGLLGFAEAGATFVFQSVEAHQIERGFGGGQPETIVGSVSPPVKTFAFWILPTIVFFSSLMSILYHLGVMQRVVSAIAWVMQRTMGTSGSESLACAANIFVGQTEAPLVVRPYVATMTRSELHALMCGGFATIAGGVMAMYVSFLSGIPGIAGHLVTASILSAPAALAISKVMVPETEVSQTAGQVGHMEASPAANVMEAAAHGASEGMKLALNVAAMLIAFVGLIAMINLALSAAPVGFCPDGVVWGYPPEACAPLTLERALGWVFAPIALAMGVPWSECALVGELLGEKLVLTELIAYIHLGELTTAAVPVLSERSAVIASYGLCGFANFASIGIQLGGIGGLAPQRLGDLSQLALRAMIGGSLAAFMTGNVAGVLL